MDNKADFPANDAEGGSKKKCLWVSVGGLLLLVISVVIIAFVVVGAGEDCDKKME